MTTEFRSFEEYYQDGIQKQQPAAKEQHMVLFASFFGVI
jgi:hypothetical protein